MARRDQQLYRDPDDKMIAGVCSGLGHYFDIDTTLVRVVLAALTLAGGGGVIAYLILWFVVDEAPSGHWDAEEAFLGQGTLDLTDGEPAGASNPGR